jgi:hypothetical protein
METEEQFIGMFKQIITNTVREVEGKLTDIITQELRKYEIKSVVPPYLNTTEFKKLTGIGNKKQSYLRQTGQIAYSKNGRSITYKREDVEKFLEDHRVSKKEKFC